MKRILIVITALLIFAPLHASAVYCMQDSYTCSCVYQDLSNGEGTVEENANNLMSSCITACTPYATKGNVNWSLICTDNEGNDAPVGAGTITSQEAVAETEDNTEGGEKRNPIIPNLNVAIPGLDFSNGLTYDADGNLNINYLASYVDALYRFLMVAMALVAIIMLMVGGFQYILSRGHADAVKQAKTRMVNAVTGMVLLMSAYTIAFLIDPHTVKFATLKIKTIEYVATADFEDFADYMPAIAIVQGDDVTQLVGGGGTHLIVSVKSGDTYIGKDVLTKLTAAAGKFYTASNALNPGNAKNIRVTSGSRSIQKQATLFYENCVAKNGYCSPDTCNVDGSDKTVISKVSGKWTLTDAYSGISKSEVIAGLVAHGDGRNCTHTNNVAADLWAEGSGTGFQFDVTLQNLMTQTLFANGFCRIPNEPWHFELAGQGSSSCNTAFGDSSYRIGGANGTVYSTALCKTWDAKNHCCVTPISESVRPTTMCR